MAKLTKMEISAIASRIVEDIEKKVKEENKKLVSKEAYDKWFSEFKKTNRYKVYMKYLDALNNFNTAFEGVKVKNTYGGFYTVSVNAYSDTASFLEGIFKQEVTIGKMPSASTQTSIERDIIIAQAKNEDIEALITELTNKYSN